MVDSTLFNQISFGISDRAVKRFEVDIGIDLKPLDRGQSLLSNVLNFSVYLIFHTFRWTGVRSFTFNYLHYLRYPEVPGGTYI